MNIKISQPVAAAVALVAAAEAHSIDLSTVSTSNIAFLSGSTSIDNAIQQHFINTFDGLCASSSADIYSDMSVGVKFTAVACNSGSHAIPIGIALNTPIAYIKEDNAGSLNGITPVNNNTVIPFPTVTTIDTTNCGATSPHTCNTSVTATNRAPNLGFSDVEAELFGATTNNVISRVTVDTIYGIAANLGFYHALQNLQLGLTGTNADDTTAHMPSLHRSQVYTMLQGLLPPSILKNSAGTTSAGATAQLFGTNTNANSFCGHSTVACATSDANNLYLCMRGQSSGTRKVSEIYFGNFGCAADIAALAAPSHATCAAQGCSWVATFQNDLVFAGNGTGDVLSCLQAHDSVGHFAIGIVNTATGWGQFQPNGARKDWRFIKLEGVVPSIENVAANKYEYWAQSLAYTPKDGRGNMAAHVAARLVVSLDGSLDTSGFSFSSADHVNALNRPFYTAPGFDGGFLAIPAAGRGNNTPNASNVTPVAFRDNPVNNYNKGFPDMTNNCQNPTLDILAPDSANDAVWAVP